MAHVRECIVPSDSVVQADTRRAAQFIQLVAHHAAVERQGDDVRVPTLLAVGRSGDEANAKTVMGTVWILLAATVVTALLVVIVRGGTRA